MFAVRADEADREHKLVISERSLARVLRRSSRPRIVAPAMPYVFGYGSLVVPEAEDPGAPVLLPCALRGFRRTWGVAMDNSVDLPGYKHFLDARTGARPDVRVAFLDLEEAASGDAEVGGVARWVEQHELPALDARERNYRRIEVGEHLDRELPPPVFTYVGLPEARARTRAKPVVVARDYLDAVRAGFAAWGEEALTAFESSTAAPPGPVLDLRLIPHPPLTDGERWARDELTELLARRFTLRAVAGFLLDSQRRATEVRAAHPALGRQARRWMAAGAAAWAGLAAGGAEPFRRRAGGGLAWWAGCALMLDWHLGMVETEDGRPRPLGVADALTLGRAWLVPVAADSPTPLVCAAAAATDVLDGRFARRDQPTRIGRDLEGLVDTCFAGAALRAARRREWVGRGAVGAELARLGAGFAYAVWIYFGRASAPDPLMTRAARVITPVRVGGLIAAGVGRRRLAGALIAGGALASLAATARSWTAARR